MTQTARAPAIAVGMLPAQINTSFSPCVVYHAGTVLMLYRGVGSDPGIYLVQSESTPSGPAWSNGVRLPLAVNTSDSPAALWMGHYLYVVYKGVSGDPGIYVVRTSDLGQTWQMTRFDPGVTTNVAPAAFGLNGSVYVLFQSSTDAHVWAEELPADATWNPIS
jgi:hypothetical protein